MQEIEERLQKAGLRITPQRIAVLESVLSLHPHPSMEEIIEKVQKENSHISTATIYRTVDLFYEKEVLGKVKTRSGSMRIDAESSHHHHLINEDESRIEDYHNPELDQILRDYFTKKGIENFEIDNINVEIQGKFSFGFKTKK